MENMGANYEFSICVARIFNRPETLARIFLSVKDANFPAIRQILLDMQYNEHQIWSGAYLITTHGRKMTKLDYCLEILEQAYYRFQLKPVLVRTCAEWHRYTMSVEGFGSFLAAQVVADLKNTIGHPLQKADDWFTFSAPGPGSLRGLSWFHGRPVTERTYEADIYAVYDYLYRYGIQRIHFQDLQNCLCEFDKYCRVATGSGRSKRKYPGLK